MPRFGMAIDTKKCVGCMDCVVACQTENDVPSGFSKDWIVTEVKGKFPDLSMEIRSERCHHCDNPPCVYVCPTGASHIEDWGKTVQITEDKCIGCKACLAACPYGARFAHPDGYADKCTFCIHRVKEEPRSGMRLGVPDALHSLWRPRRLGEPRQQAFDFAGFARGASGSGHQTTNPLPEVR